MKMAAMMSVVLLTPAAFAADMSDELAERLDAKRLIEIQSPQLVGPKICTPMAVRFVRNGDFAPTCGLMLKSGRYVDLVSPEPGQSLPACASPLKGPIHFFAKNHYIVYEYEIEDPRANITRAFQLFALTNNEIEACKNDGQLTDAAQKSVNTKGVAMSFKNAVLRFGCKR